MARETKNAGNGPDSNGQPFPQERKLSALDRAIVQAIGDGRKVGLEDDPAQDDFPLVWEWLTKTEGGRDYIMQPAVISIQLGPEGVLVSLTHRDLRVSCTVSCAYLSEVMPVLQAALAAPNPPIRSWGKDLPNLKKRKSKS